MNDFVFNQIFKAHRWLWIAASYSRYEEEQTSLRSGCHNFDPDPEGIHAKRFRYLLPFVLSHDDLNVDYQCQHDELLERLVDIENTYLVFKRSIDFDVALGNNLRRVLAYPRKPGPKRDLLSEVQYANVADIFSSIGEWEDKPETAGDGPSMWATLLQAQREIDESGRVSLESRGALESLNAAKPNRKKTYARQVLLILLAEFFDDFSDQALETNISDCCSDEEWDAKTGEKVKDARKRYDSPFARFLTEFYALVGVETDAEPSEECISSLRQAALIEAAKKSSVPELLQRTEFEKLLHNWHVDMWHEKLGLERGLNLRRRANRQYRLTEKILNGGDCEDIADALRTIDQIKPAKS